MKKKFSLLTYVKLVLLIFLYFYLFVYSSYSLWKGIQEDKELMAPLLGLVFCIAIGAYILIGKNGKPNPLDRKVGVPAIVTVIILFFAMVGILYWYSGAIGLR